MRLKSQCTKKSNIALGVYIDQQMIAVSIVDDGTGDSTHTKNVRLLTQIEDKAESSTDDHVQDVMTLCADELGDTTCASGCWIAIRQAQCLTVPLGAFSQPKALLHLDAAQTVSAHVVTHVSQHVNHNTSLTEVESLSQSSWLDDARPKEPPIFDYLLRKRQDEADAVEAWLWWASGESEIELKNAVTRTGTPVEGLVLDGIALYRGLLDYWQENGVSRDCLQGEWVLIDGSTQTSAWFFYDCWFQARKHYEDGDIVRDPEINRQCTVVIWRCTNDPESFCCKAEAVFDHLLRPQDLQGRVPPARETLSSLIALVLALQGVEPRLSEWHSAGHSPSINLLPWRGQRLQQLRSRLFVHIGTVASLLSLVALLGAGLLNEALTRDRERLSALTQQLEQREQDKRQAEQQRKKWRQDERTRDDLVRLAGTGERQLDYLRRVLELIPACVSLTQIVLSGSGISVSGITSDPAKLRDLPANLFTAFAEGGENILHAWPSLLMDTSRYDPPEHYDEQGRFVLQVPFDNTLNVNAKGIDQHVNKMRSPKERQEKET